MSVQTIITLTCGHQIVYDTNVDGLTQYWCRACRTGRPVADRRLVQDKPAEALRAMDIVRDLMVANGAGRISAADLVQALWDEGIGRGLPDA